jgi:hypothetical protein
MTELFPIVDVAATPERTEPIGSKAKFWFRRPGDPALWLYKEARPNTGEDWAEKLAAEFAERLGLPHAVVELAEHNGSRGVVIRDFTDGQRRGALVHGNELLFEVDETYPKERSYRVHQHTLRAVASVLDAPTVVLTEGEWPASVTTPWGGFIGYLALDALIGNTDRHHQNWGLLVRPDAPQAARELAPTFDHASSLGRELLDEQREFRLSTPDGGGNVRAYVSRARSAFYGDHGHTLSPEAAFVAASARDRAAGQCPDQECPTRLELLR